MLQTAAQLPQLDRPWMVGRILQTGVEMLDGATRIGERAGVEERQLKMGIGVDPYLVLQSIKKLQEFNPSILFFPHGGATADVAIHHIEGVTQRCLDTALKLLKAGENHKIIAKNLIEI